MKKGSTIQDSRELNKIKTISYIYHIYQLNITNRFSLCQAFRSNKLKGGSLIKVLSNEMKLFKYYYSWQKTGVHDGNIVLSESKTYLRIGFRDLPGFPTIQEFRRSLLMSQRTGFIIFKHQNLFEGRLIGKRRKRAFHNLQKDQEKLSWGTNIRASAINS